MTVDRPDRPDQTEHEERLRLLNAMSFEEAYATLLACCGSTEWARRVASERPFRDERKLFEAAELAWWRLKHEDWLEAFRAHPKIGERKAERETGETARGWSEQEQKGARAASTETLEELARLNREYEERFGHIYIVCATGKTAEEMLQYLKRRITNDQRTELIVAAEEQRRITRIRLKKLLGY